MKKILESKFTIRDMHVGIMPCSKVIMLGSWLGTWLVFFFIHIYFKTMCHDIIWGYILLRLFTFCSWSGFIAKLGVISGPKSIIKLFWIPLFLQILTWRTWYRHSIYPASFDLWLLPKVPRGGFWSFDKLMTWCMSNKRRYNNELDHYHHCIICQFQKFLLMISL